MKKWQYNFVPYEAATADDVSDFLDAQGQDGWEVVSHTYDYEADGINVTFVLKREIEEDEPAAEEVTAEQTGDQTDEQAAEQTTEQTKEPLTR